MAFWKTKMTYKKMNLLWITLFATAWMHGQKLYTKTGVLNFEASVETFEAVKATNDGTTVVLDCSNGRIAALALIRGFHFKNALMEEHFNENYIESNEYPKASFRGDLENFDYETLDKKETSFTLKGNLTIRGISKSIETQAVMSKTDDGTTLSLSFVVSPSDFDIKIPAPVKNKIAQEIIVSTDLLLIER